MNKLIVRAGRGKVASCVVLAMTVALTGVSWGGEQLRYTPVPGGYRTSNGDGEFNRPLYGWHGDDRELNPCKSLPWTSDRPKVALKVFRGYQIDSKVRGVLQFGDGTDDVEYRYV